MPIYEYQGQKYELSTSDHAEAKAKILNYLGQNAPAPVQAQAAPAPTEDAPQVTDPMGTGLSSEIMAQVPPKKESVLQGMQMPAPAVPQDKVVNPKFIEAMKRNLDAMTPEERQAKLDYFLQRPDVYGRAARVVAGQYEAMNQAPDLTKPYTDTRMESIQQQLIDQGMEANAARAEAQKRAFLGSPGAPLQQAKRDIVGEQADMEAAQRAQELKDAGFFSRVGAEAKSQAAQTGLGLLNMYADLTGDKQMQSNVQGALRVETEAGKAIPVGESLAAKSAQHAMATLAGQAPWILGSALTGTAGPALAQAGIQVFGSEYGQGRQAGLTPGEAATRAGLMASAEILFERYGLADELKAIRGVVDRIPTDKLAGYLASAIAKEVPSEQLTSATQFLIDKAPGIGLNPKAGWKDFLEDQAETLRQTIIQSGTLGGTVMGTAKGAQLLADKLGPEAPKYERDTSYDGLAELLARTKGFLQPEAEKEALPPPPAAEEKITPEPVKPTIKAEERQARIDELANQRMEAGIDPEDAMRMATEQVEREYSKAAEKVPTVPVPTNRVEQLTQEFIDAGQAPQNARAMAEQQVAQEAEDDARAAQDTQGAPSVGATVPEAGGVSPAMAGKPSQVVAPAGAGASQQLGVVPAGQNVAAAPAGERVEPVAVNEIPAQTPLSAPVTENVEAQAPAGTAQNVEAQQAAEQQATALMEAAPKKPGAKRGRKPQELTPEQQAEKETATKEYKRKYAKGERDYARALKELELAAQLPEREDFQGSDEQYQGLLDEKRAQVVSGITNLLSIEKNHRGSALGNRAKEILNDRAKIPQALYNQIKKSWESTQHSKSLASSRATPNELLKGRMSAAQVLTAIGKKGTPFERMLANRIRNALSGVTVYVVEKGDPVPPRIQEAANAEAWERARGVFIQDAETGVREVYLRGASYGLQNGTNNVTALHELLHAALNHRIGAGLLGSAAGKDNAQLVKLFQELASLMEVASKRYDQLERAGVLPTSLQRIVEATLNVDPETLDVGYEIFELPQEFLAYGLSDPAFQQFLMGVEGRRTDESAFSRFVRTILEFLGLAPGQFTALSDLINITDDMLGAHTADLVTPSKNRAFMAAKIQLTPEEKAAAAAQREVDRAVSQALNKYEVSKQAEDFSKGVTAAQMVQNPRKVIPVLRRLYDAGNNFTRKQFANKLTNDVLTMMFGADVPEIKNTSEMLQKMQGNMMQLLRSAGELTKDIHRAYRKDPSLAEKLNKITSVATLAEVDPSDPTSTKRNAQLDQMYNALGSDGQQLYKRIKQHYESLSEYMGTLLDDQITRSGLPLAERQNLLKKVRAMYETGSKITPYFPLVRRGDYWFSMGTGKNRVFMMFESLPERDAAIDGFVSMRLKQKPGESNEAFEKRKAEERDELFETEAWGYGNDITALRQRTTQSSELLKGMFEAIDASDMTSPDAKEQLKDDIYQLYLQTMPEQSFRKQFIHRKGLAGFRTDLLRNVADTTSKMSVQLSRIKYAPLLRNSIAQATASVTNRPNLAPVVEEMRQRVSSALNPQKESDASKVAGALTKLGYIFYLGGASSAIIQPLSIIQTGMPVLSRYGVANANREFLKAMQVWSTLGVWKKNLDGTESFVAPSIEFATGLSAEDKRAVKAMQALDVFSSTYANAVFDYSKKPTAKLSGPVAQTAKNTIDVLILGGLMHSTERLSREMVGLMSYRLNRQAGKSFEESVRQAGIDVNESLGNYADYNKPTFMKGAGAKVLTQFMSYPLHVIMFLARNFKEIVKPMDGRTRWEAAKKFFGALGATLVLSGVSGLPWVFGATLGFISAMWRAMSGDDDRPKDVRDMDYMFWLRTKWLDDQLGGTQIGGKKLSDIVDRGLLNAVTGVDFASRTSLNNLWLREKKDEKDIHSAAAELALSLAGPAPNAIVSMAEGLSAFMEGDTKRGVQKMAPAGLRNFANAYNYYREGAKDNKGAEILSRDGFTAGQLLFQAVGFRSDKLANTQYVNFKVIGLDQGIRNQRAALLNNLDRAYRDSDVSAYTKYFKQMEQFNKDYPSYRLEIDDLIKSLEGKAERRGKSWKGIVPNEQNVPLFADVLRPSRQ